MLYITYTMTVLEILKCCVDSLLKVFIQKIVLCSNYFNIKYLPVNHKNTHLYNICTLYIFKRTHMFLFIFKKEKKKTVIVFIQARMGFQIEYFKMFSKKHLMSTLQIHHVKIRFIKLGIYNHNICIHMHIVSKIPQFKLI